MSWVHFLFITSFQSRHFDKFSFHGARVLLDFTVITPPLPMLNTTHFLFTFQTLQTPPLPQRCERWVVVLQLLQLLVGVAFPHHATFSQALFLKKICPPCGNSVRRLVFGALGFIASSNIQADCIPSAPLSKMPLTAPQAALLIQSAWASRVHRRQFRRIKRSAFVLFYSIKMWLARRAMRQARR